MARVGAGTHCNLSHCGWYTATGLQLAVVDPLAWRTRLRELRVTVQPAGRKGLGVFAAQTAGPGRWVCSYGGELLNLSQLLTRYAASTPTYVYRLSSTLSIDARDSTHFSRYINHHAQPNLHAKVNRRSTPARIDFFTIRPLRLAAWSKKVPLGSATARHPCLRLALFGSRWHATLCRSGRAAQRPARAGARAPASAKVAGGTLRVVVAPRGSMALSGTPRGLGPGHQPRAKSPILRRFHLDIQTSATSCSSTMA